MISIGTIGLGIYPGLAVFENDIAKYWKKGNPVTLSSKQSYATSIAGWELNGTSSVAFYWKNVVPIHLTDGVNGASANAIFIATK